MSEPFPRRLSVYLSNRCNLACSYCYVAIDRGPGESLGFERLGAGLDYFLDRAPAQGRKILFLGGEPLLDFRLLSGGVARVRRADASIPIHLFTNGLLLDAQRLRFLRAHAVEIVVGFGGAAVRVSDPVREALRAPGHRFSANLVVGPSSVASFLGQADRIYRAGFRRLRLAPDVGAVWTGRDTARLATALDGLRRYASAVAVAGKALEVSGPRPSAEGEFPCDQLILAADGRFYACDKVLGASFDALESCGVGSPREGLNGARRREFVAAAVAAAREVLGPSARTGCPGGVYARWRIGADRSTESLSERLRGFGAVSELIRDRLARP